LTNDEVVGAGEVRPGQSLRSRALCAVRKPRPDAVALALLAAIWILIIVIIHPIGNFPLNDDWVYGKTVKLLVEHGQLKFGDSFATYLGQVLWGWLFCLPAGFSFSALRLSSLVLALLGSWAMYGLLKEMGVGRAIAFVGSLTLLTNPVFMSLASTFMTDIHRTCGDISILIRERSQNRIVVRHSLRYTSRLFRG